MLFSTSLLVIPKYILRIFFFNSSVCFQAENSALSMENDNQRKQYERCLDEVRLLFKALLLSQLSLAYFSVNPPFSNRNGAMMWGFFYFIFFFTIKWCVESRMWAISRLSFRQQQSLTCLNMLTNSGSS